MNKEKFLYNLWLWKCNKKELNVIDEKINIDDLYKTEWSNRFELLCRNRLVLGAMRYGKIHAENKPLYNRVKSIIKRASAYQQSGNLEHLVDIANLAMLEFEECGHPLRHFTPIDDGEHAEVIHE